MNTVMNLRVCSPAQQMSVSSEALCFVVSKQTSPLTALHGTAASSLAVCVLAMCEITLCQQSCKQVKEVRSDRGKGPVNSRVELSPSTSNYY
jgi:hypothetical protein